MKKQIAVVTGANRGIGLEVVRQLAEKGYTVVLTSRDEAKGKKSLTPFTAKKLDVHYHRLDVTDAKSIADFKNFVEKEFGRLDVLVNNAGVLLDTDSPNSPDAFLAKVETVRKTMDTNVYGPLLLCQHLIPLMKKSGYGRIVNISSGMGQLSDMNGGYVAYRISKTALNAVTRIFSAECEGTGILVNSICPGWVKTDMGGAGAELPVEKGAETAVWAATLPANGPTGGFFREMEAIEW